MVDSINSALKRVRHEATRKVQTVVPESLFLRYMKVSGSYL
jgi:hypothetical protein